MRRTINYKVESIWRARAGRVLLNAIDPAQGALTTKLLLTVGDDLSFLFKCAKFGTVQS